LSKFLGFEGGEFVEAKQLLATNIKAIIREKGLKQYAVAARADMTGKRLSNALNARALLNADEIARIARALGTTPNALFKHDERPCEQSFPRS